MPYLLSVSRLDLLTRRKRWIDPSYRSRVRVIGSPELPNGYPGLLALVDDEGEVRHRLTMDNPKGMLVTPAGLLVACFSELRLVAADLSGSTVFRSEPRFNDLHSLRPSPSGFVLAAAGLDAAYEFSAGGEEAWDWWAAEHGFTVDAQGRRVVLAKDADHRNFGYPVDMQSTHLNAVAAADDSTFVATVFQHGKLISIDRHTGKVATLLGGLSRPHAVRVLADGMITLADTAAGEAVQGRLEDGRFEVLERIRVNTTWLHDAYFDGSRWMFVDGANSRVLHADARGDVDRVDIFDPDWCLYEVLPCAPVTATVPQRYATSPGFSAQEVLRTPK